MAQKPPKVYPTEFTEMPYADGLVDYNSMQHAYMKSQLMKTETIDCFGDTQPTFTKEIITMNMKMTVQEIVDTHKELSEAMLDIRKTLNNLNGNMKHFDIKDLSHDKRPSIQILVKEYLRQEAMLNKLLSVTVTLDPNEWEME